MRRLRLVRDRFTATTTLGALYDEQGTRLAYTLEDAARPAGVKVPGQTCILPGTYQVVVTASARFKRELPLLQGVVGFSGVRMHNGNTHESTEGCILLGTQRDDKAARISECAPATDAITALIKAEGSVLLDIVPVMGWGE